jgi:hypothetical protein
LVVLLLAANLWAWRRLDASRQRAMRAWDDLGRCGQLAEQVIALRNRPGTVAARELAAAELASRVEHAAAAAQVPTSSILRISPEPPQRLGDSGYLEKPTQLHLRQLTLRQLVGLLRELVVSSSSSGGGATGLQPRSLRLVAPREQETGQQWNVEATLSYLIYSPPPHQQHRAGGRAGGEP